MINGEHPFKENSQEGRNVFTWGFQQNFFVQEVVFCLDLKGRILKRRRGYFSKQKVHKKQTRTKQKHTLQKENERNIKWITTGSFVYT